MRPVVGSAMADQTSHLIESSLQIHLFLNSSVWEPRIVSISFEYFPCHQHAQSRGKDALITPLYPSVSTIAGFIFSNFSREAMIMLSNEILKNYQRHSMLFDFRLIELHHWQLHTITLFYIRGRPLYPFNRSVFTYIPILNWLVVTRFQVLRFHF
jgi:hypothetical protein